MQTDLCKKVSPDRGLEELIRELLQDVYPDERITAQMIANKTLARIKDNKCFHYLTPNLTNNLYVVLNDNTRYPIALQTCVTEVMPEVFPRKCNQNMAVRMWGLLYVEFWKRQYRFHAIQYMNPQKQIHVYIEPMKKKPVVE